MKLNEDQQAMLDGKYGEGAAYAMKIQVGIGECFDAERMVPIKRAHVALSNQAGDLWFAEKLVAAGAKCRVAPTVNPGWSLDFFKKGWPDLTDADIDLLLDGNPFDFDELQSPFQLFIRFLLNLVRLPVILVRFPA